ncbi:transposase [Gammaproteobacteria bacterium]
MLLQVVMLYCGIDLALRAVAGNATLLNEKISDTAIQNRLKACGPWIKALLKEMLPAGVALPDSLRILVVDGSTVQGPGAKDTWNRIHLAINLVTLEIAFVEVTDRHGGESLKRYPFQEGDIVMVDRGYNQPRAIADLDKDGVMTIVRLNPWSMPLYERGEDSSSDKRVDLVERLSQTTGDYCSIAVDIGTPTGERCEGYVHAYRLTPEQAEAARRRCRQNNDNTPSKATLFYAGWVMVFTTVPVSVLSMEVILSVYRARWQVELVIKRLKSILDLDLLRARRDSILGDVWLHGKLLYAMVIEKIARRKNGGTLDSLSQARTHTPWRLLRMVKLSIDTAIASVSSWNNENWIACIDVMKERPRRRQLQTLPDPVRQLLAYRNSAIAGVV